MTEPDIVEVRFKNTDIFVDKETFTVLEPNFVMRVNLPPQVTLDKAAALDEMEESVDEPMKYIAIFQIAGNLAMAVGLKYLWNMVNLFQFLIFFQQQPLYFSFSSF